MLLLLLGFVLSGLFYWYVRYNIRKRDICRAIAVRIESILAGEALEEAELEGLMRLGVITEKELGSKGWWTILKPSAGWQWSFVVMIFTLWIVLGFAFW